MEKSPQKIFFCLILVLLASIPDYCLATRIDSIATPELWLEQQNELGQKLLNKTLQFDQAVTIFQKAYDFSIAQELQKEFIDLSVGYGFALYRNGDIENAYNVLTEALQLLKASDLKNKAKVNQIIGMCLIFQDKYPEAYQYQINALEYFQSINDSSGVMSVYYDLGANFSNQGQFELALENYSKGLSIAKNLNDAKMTMFGNTAIGGSYAHLNDFETALDYNNQSIHLADSINDIEELAWASINRGHLLGRMNRNEEAEKYLLQAYDISFEIGNKLLTAYSLEQLSDIKSNQGQLTEASNKLGEALRFYEELGQKSNIKNVIKKYADISFKQKDFEKFKEYTDKYIEMKDSIFSEELKASLADLKENYEIQKLERENQIAMIKKDQELSNTKNYATVVITCSTALILFLLLALLLYQNKNTKERNELLRAKNEEITRQNKFLADSNRDLEKFAYIISHDLKEPLRNINGFTKLLNRQLNKYQLDEKANEYAKFIINSTRQMEELLVGLLEYSKISTNKTESELIDTKKIVEGVLHNLTIQLEEKNCQIDIKGEFPKVKCRKTQLSQVFQNLIANAIKFSKESNNIITIEATDKEDHFRFMIKDKGIGIAPEFQKDIFVVFQRLHNRGEFSGSGIGLATCKKVIEDHGGQIWVESEEGKGSCFYFTLPKEYFPAEDNSAVQNIALPVN